MVERISRKSKFFLVLVVKKDFKHFVECNDWVSLFYFPLERTFQISDCTFCGNQFSYKISEVREDKQ